MKASLRFTSAGKGQDFATAEFPLALGTGQDGELLFGAAAEPAAVAWLGLDDGQVFLQPVDGSEAVRLNDSALKTSAWLVAGDRLEVGRTSIAVSVDGGVAILATADAKQPDRGTEIAAPALQNAMPPGRPMEKAGRTATPAGPVRIRSSGTTGRNLVIALFLVLLAGVVFVLTASPVRLTVSPTPDSLRIDGLVPPIPFSGRYLVMPGSYSITADKAGYRTLERSVSIEFGAEPVFEFEMSKLPGYLDVVSLPIADARIELDGKEIGRTPLSAFEIEAGRHQLRVTAERYLPFDSAVEIVGMGTKQTIEVTLQPGWGTLVLTSEPSDAKVRLSGKEIGSTPLRTELMGGEHSLELDKIGWKTAAVEVTIAAGETIELPPVRLEKADGVIELSTSPPGALVTVDNQVRGRSPLTLALSSGRDHKLGVSKAGFAGATRTVRPEAGRTKSLNIELTPQYGVVFLVTQPAGAELAVDGKPRGKASQRLRLTTAPHSIEISKTGYVTFATTVTPILGESKRIEIRLEKSGKASGSGVTDSEAKANSPAGGALRLITIDAPVRFEMGASRREAGRRSNETLHSVEITRSFYIGEREVTNAEFRKFDAQHDSGAQQGLDLNGPDLPVVSVSWDDAARYANWLSQRDGLPRVYVEENGRMAVAHPISNGYRLPTEAEWAFAARYEGGRRSQNQALKYPWGAELPPPANSGNYADETGRGKLPLIIRGYSDGFLFAAPAGRFPPNKAGIQDLGGNVAEWCHDYYGVTTNTGSRPLTDPTGPEAGGAHVVRGSSWRHGSITELRFSYRDYSRKPRKDLGFRIARYAAEAPN